MTHSQPTSSWYCPWRQHVYQLVNYTAKRLHYINQGSRIRSVPILFSERYVHMLTYSILAYVNKNRIRRQTTMAETANWFFDTFIINLLSDSVVQNSQFNYILWHDFLSSCHGLPIELHWSKWVNVRFRKSGWIEFSIWNVSYAWRLFCERNVCMLTYSILAYPRALTSTTYRHRPSQ